MFGHQARTTSTPNPQKKGACSHCGCKTIHDKLGAGPGAAKCPLKDKLARSEARKVGKELMGALKEDPSLDVKEKVDQLIAQHQ